MPPPSDILYRKVGLRLPFDGADGATSTVDLSETPTTVTFQGGAALSTTQSMFGGASLRLNGGTDHVVVSGPALANNSLPLCLEGWIYPTAISGTQTVFDQRLTAADVPGPRVWIDAAGAIGVWISGSFAGGQSANGLIAANNWYHVAAVYEQRQVFRLFVNGVLAFSQGWGGLDFNCPNTTLRIGCDAAGANPFVGYVDDVRYTLGNCRYHHGASFAPEGPHPTSYGVPAFGVLPLSRAVLYTPAPVLGVSRTFNPLFLRGFAADGLGTITGTVKENALPSNLPLRRRAWLLRERDARVIRETWSDAVTGAYSFGQLSLSERYTVLAYDYEQNYRAVIADNLTPELMP